MSICSCCIVSFIMLTDEIPLFIQSEKILMDYKYSWGNAIVMQLML